MDTPPPSPPPSRATARRDRLAAKKPLGKAVYFSVGGIVVLIVVIYFLVVASKPDFSVQVGDMPNTPTGDPVPIAYGVRAGDAFETTIESSGGMGISVVMEIPKGGMSLDVALRARENVVARDGGLLASTVRVLSERFKTNVPGVETFPAEMTAWTARFDRDASGRPLAKSITTQGVEGSRALLLAIVLAGLADLTTNYLPPRPVRVGEVWDVSEAADVSSVPEIIRFVAGIRGDKGYPALETTGRVRAERLEPRGGEDALRLRLSVVSNIKGDVVPPAREGSIDAGMKVEGDIWVSTSTGLIVESDFRASLLSKYVWTTPKTSNERKVLEHVHTATKRLPP